MNGARESSSERGAAARMPPAMGFGTTTILP
jgi:hypothetical protein